MAGSVNKVILVGNLGADPEARAHNGSRFVNFRIATSETWKDRASGEKKERTEWHSIVVVSNGEGGLAGVAERFLRKGSKVYIEGQLRTRKWQAQDGSDRYSTEVVLSGPGAVLTMLDGAPGGGSGRSDYSGYAEGPGSGAGSGGGEKDGPSTGSGRTDWRPPSELDDEVPF